MTTVTSATSTTATASTDTTQQPTINADFNMFVKLLTAQMQNQDPLSPMDTSQYTSQLVQYSQVEQSMAQTSTLKSILSAMSTQDLTQASGLMGHQVTVDSASAGLGDTPVQWNWSASRDISGLTATIADANGNTIDQLAFNPQASGSFSWDGTLSTGGQAPKGNYSISFKAVDANGSDVPVTVSTTATVTQIAMQNGAVMLGSNGQDWPVSALTEVSAN
jgi:flagellar basal-body rod modification protein FlgD